MTIKAVIFDIGNVLIEWQPERWYDKTYGEAHRRAFFDAIDPHDMNDQVDRGGHFRDTIYAYAERHPTWVEEIRAWHDHWLELATPEIPHSVRLLRALRANGVPVFALTNFGVQNFDLACSVYPFLNEFDRRYVSGQMQMVKPESPIYAAVEADCGLPPETLLFADDRVDNIAIAKARGWQTHLFEHPAGWADCLVAHNLISPEDAK